MSLIVYPMQEEHIDRFDYDGIQLPMTENIDVRELLRNYHKAGASYAGLLGSRPVALAGMVPAWLNVGHTWMMLNKDGRVHIKSIYKNIMLHIEKVARLRGFHRIQTYVVEGDTMSMRFAEMQGLVYECTMEAFGPNRENYLIYKKVFQNGS